MNFSQAVPRVIEGHFKEKALLYVHIIPTNLGKTEVLQVLSSTIYGGAPAVRNNMLSIERPSSQSDFSCGWHLSAKDSSALICRCGTCGVKLLVQFEAHLLYCKVGIVCLRLWRSSVVVCQ